MPLMAEKKGHILSLTLSRPGARNAWEDDYNEGIVAELGKATDDDEVRVVVLTGDEDGGAFSAGANLKKPNAQAEVHRRIAAMRTRRKSPARSGGASQTIAPR